MKLTTCFALVLLSSSLVLGFNGWPRIANPNYCYRKTSLPVQSWEMDYDSTETKFENPEPDEEVEVAEPRPNQKQVLVVGAGPAGLLTAHALLSRPGYDVRIIDNRGDPRKEEAEMGPRAYSLGLNIRGQSALKYFDVPDRSEGLLKTVAAEGVECDSFYLHLGKTKLQIRKPSPPPKEGDNEDDTSKDVPVPPTVLIPRNRLCASMLNHLNDTYSQGDSANRLDVTYNCALTIVDLSTHTAELTVQHELEVQDDGEEGGSTTSIIPKSEEVSYDMIIGCDGVQSKLREAIKKRSDETSPTDSPDHFQTEDIELPGKYKVMLQTPPPPLLDPLSIHAMESSASNFSLFLIPAPGNKTCALVSWTSEQMPSCLTPTKESEESLEDVNRKVQASINKSFPLFGIPSEEAIGQLHRQEPSIVKTVRCNRYTHQEGAAILLGDAAHSTGGALGQGANSALMDVVALDHCLNETEDSIPKAMMLFSERQVPEGLALWELLQLPPKGPMGIAYQLSQLMLGLLSKLRKIRWLKWLLRPLPRATQTALSQSLEPFSRIAHNNKFWIWLATRNRVRPMTFAAEVPISSDNE